LCTLRVTATRLHFRRQPRDGHFSPREPIPSALIPPKTAVERLPGLARKPLLRPIGRRESTSSAASDAEWTDRTSTANSVSSRSARFADSRAERTGLPIALLQWLSGRSQAHSPASPESPDPPQTLLIVLERLRRCHPIIDRLLGSSERFHPDVQLAALKDLPLQLHQEVRQKSQTRSHGKTVWLDFRDLRLRA
jgi:hypothetical protein